MDPTPWKRLGRMAAKRAGSTGHLGGLFSATPILVRQVDHLISGLASSKVDSISIIINLHSTPLLSYLTCVSSSPSLQYHTTRHVCGQPTRPVS